MSKVNFVPSPSPASQGYLEKFNWWVTDSIRKIAVSLNRLNDGFLFNQESVSSAYTATLGDSIILASGTTTVTLPRADEARYKRFTVKNIGSGVITVTASSGNIDNATSQKITATLTSLDFVSDGANYWII